MNAQCFAAGTLFAGKKTASIQQNMVREFVLQPVS